MPQDGTANLIPMDERTVEEQKRITTMGGKASGEARRAKRTLREIYSVILDMPATPDMIDETAEAVKAAEKATGAKLTVYDIIALAQAQKAAKGDTAAAQYVRDSAGDKPTDKQEVTATVAGNLTSLAELSNDELLKMVQDE